MNQSRPANKEFQLGHEDARFRRQDAQLHTAGRCYLGSSANQ